jgi:TldD protein
MPSTRRLFLKTGATVTTAALTNALTARPLLAALGGRPEPVPPIQDPRLKELVQRGLDAAMQAGAQYADIRLTHDRFRKIISNIFTDVYETESMTVGVRALVNGYWGFSSSPVWQHTEMVRLAHEAIEQAKTNALGKPRVVELAPRPRVEDSHWIMPVKIDPFMVHPAEIMEHLIGLVNYIHRQPPFSGSASCTIFQQEKAFGASDGSYFTQRIYRTGGWVGVALDAHNKGIIEELEEAAIGWELFVDQPIRTYIDRTREEVWEDYKLPKKPVDVGKFDAVLDARSMGNILSSSVGAATELDRAFGYEANASGTSYLNQPLEMLGTYQLGNSLLNITATRHDPGGLAWVEWDDEGVRPEPFPLIKEGVVVGFQTTRESAAWLQAAPTAQRNTPLTSKGCAAAPAADDAPLTHTPNLVLHPSTENVNFDGLIATLSKGVAFKGLDVRMDFQQLNGLGRIDEDTGARAYEIHQGKKVARLQGVGILFRSPEFWKSLSAIGGTKSVQRTARSRTKGEPRQTTYHSVTVVPGLVRNVSVIDHTRKA